MPSSTNASHRPRPQPPRQSPEVICIDVDEDDDICPPAVPAATGIAAYLTPARPKNSHHSANNVFRQAAEARSAEADDDDEQPVEDGIIGMKVRTSNRPSNS